MSKHEDTSSSGNGHHQVKGCMPDSSNIQPPHEVDSSLRAGITWPRRIMLFPFCFQKLSKILQEILLYVGSGEGTEEEEKKKKRINSFELVKIRTCFNER